jgi:hypothetical protein
MNSIARFAVKYPVTVLMLVLGIVLLGFISFGKLGTDLFPDLNTPKIYIELKSLRKRLKRTMLIRSNRFRCNRATSFRFHLHQRLDLPQ